MNSDWFRGFEDVSLSVDETTMIVHQISKRTEEIIEVFKHPVFTNPEAQFVSARHIVSWIILNMHTNEMVQLDWATQRQVVEQATEAIRAYANNPTKPPEPEVF